MIKKILLSLLLVLTTMQLHAQEATVPLRFGYFSYDAVLKAMPDYAVAQQSLATLRTQYDEEMKRVEDEFNAKYETFLDTQRDLAPSIRQKRQAELQELMQKNMAFKEKARQLLQQAEHDTMQPLRQKITTAVITVGKQHAYAFILNTDANAVPFINPLMGEDATAAITAILK